MATVSERQRELRNVACIVGVDESDQIGTLPNVSQRSGKRATQLEAAREYP